MPKPSPNFGFKIHGEIHNDWVKGCRPDEWCFVSAEGFAHPGGDGNHLLMIFDTVSGPRRILFNGYMCEVFESHPVDRPVQTHEALKHGGGHHDGLKLQCDMQSTKNHLPFEGGRYKLEYRKEDEHEDGD